MDGNRIQGAAGELTMKGENGNEVHYAYCDVWRFRGDKLAELKDFVIRTGTNR